jgi:type II secretory pathway component GspD/PulD (secretin)
MAAMRDQLDHAKQELAQRQMQLAQAAQQMAEQAQGRALPPLENAELRIFHLKYVPAASAAKAIETLFGAGAIRVAVDDRTNSLILLTKPDSLKVMEALLQNLDQEARDDREKKQPQPSKAAAKQSLLLRLFWLADGLPEDEGTDPADVLPSSVLNATKKLGLANPRLVAQAVSSLAVSGNEAANYSADVPAQLIKRNVLLNYDGKVTLDAGSQAAVAMQVNVSGEAGNSNLQGSLAMPLGHYMVLGTANTLIPETVARRPRPVGGRMLGGEFGPEGGRGPGDLVPADGEMGGQARPEMKFDASRFAFVVQVIAAESFPPEEPE